MSLNTCQLIIFFWYIPGRQAAESWSVGIVGSLNGQCRIFLQQGCINSHTTYSKDHSFGDHNGSHLSNRAQMWASRPHCSQLRGLVFGNEEGSHHGNIWGTFTEHLIATAWLRVQTTNDCRCPPCMLVTVTCRFIIKCNKISSQVIPSRLGLCICPTGSTEKDIKENTQQSPPNTGWT